MSEHEKLHSRFGGSSCARWLSCPGSVALCATVPNVSSSYADEGSAAHALAEVCLRKDDHPTTYMGAKFPPYDAYPVTQEMCDVVVVFLEAVTHEQAKSKTSELYVEKGFTLDIRGTEPGEIFGTNDAMVYHPELKRLAVFDYKHGAGVTVDVTDNAQLKFYAAGALLSNPDWPVHDIELFVVQPRAFDADGEVRSWVFQPEDLIDFVSELETGVAEAKDVIAGYSCTGQLIGMHDHLDDEPRLNTGSHCRWCPAAAVCPAKEAEIIEGMGLAVAGLSDVTVDDLPPADTLDLERIASIIRTAAILGDWAAQVNTFAEGLLMSGTPVPGFKIVNKLARRKWIAAEQDIADTLVLSYGLEPDIVQPRKLVTITEAEKLIKAAISDPEQRKSALDDVTLQFTIKESSGTTMVPVSDKRPALDLAANALHGLNTEGMD